MVHFVSTKALQFELHVSVIQSQFIATALRIEYGHLLLSSGKSNNSESKLQTALSYYIYLQLF